MPVVITATRAPRRPVLRVRRRTILDSDSEAPMFDRLRPRARFRRTLDDSDSDDDTILTDISESPDSYRYERFNARLEGVEARVKDILDAPKRAAVGLEILKDALSLFTGSHKDLERLADSATQWDKRQVKREWVRKLDKMKFERRRRQQNPSDIKVLESDEYLEAYKHTYYLVMTKNAPVLEMTMVSWKAAYRAMEEIRRAYEAESYKRELAKLRRYYEELNGGINSPNRFRQRRDRLLDHRRIRTQRLTSLEAMATQIEEKISNSEAVSKNKLDLKEALRNPKKLWLNRKTYFSAYR